MRSADAIIVLSSGGRICEPRQQLGVFLSSARAEAARAIFPRLWPGSLDCRFISSTKFCVPRLDANFHDKSSLP